MPKVTIYTAMLCGYCHAAKRLLREKGADFTEVDVTLSPSKRAEMRERAGGCHTVPQVFVGETHVGGYTELSEFDDDGRLDALLQGGQGATG